MIYDRYKKIRKAPNQHASTAIIGNRKGNPVDDLIDPALPAGKPALQTFDTTPLLDKELIVDLITDMGETYVAAAMSRVLQSTTESLLQMSRLHLENDCAGAALISHRAAGAAAVFGLRALYSEFLAYEQAIDAKAAHAATLALSVLPGSLADTIASLRRSKEFAGI